MDWCICLYQYHRRSASRTASRPVVKWRFEAIIEIWGKGLLFHAHLVLVVRAETRENDTNTCLTEEVMGAARIN